MQNEDGVRESSHENHGIYSVTWNVAHFGRINQK